MRCEFGDLTFDSDSRELLRDRQRLTLSPKAFQLLHILIERRPTVLSKSELQNQLWPDTFVVEANLSNLIGELRHALRDDPRRPRFIRTVHRFGYAFCAETRTPDVVRTVSDRAVCRILWTGGRVTLRIGEHIIGRDPDCAVFLDSPSVSRRHGRILVEPDHATFEDLGSKNGSSVAGRPVHGPVALADGDTVTTGIVDLTFRMVPPVPTESV